MNPQGKLPEAVRCLERWTCRILLFSAVSSVFAAATGEVLAAEWANKQYGDPATVKVRYFVPNDPYFHRDTPTPGWPGQWHLVNEHVAGRDTRVQGAWERNITGQGVIIGICDDSLQTAHPDLAPNYTPAHSWDFGQGDSDPNPVYGDDEHGVSVAGVAAARGGNGVGVTGAAPYAGLAGLRIDFPNQNPQMFVDATLYHSSGGNTAIAIKNHSYGVPADYVFTTDEDAALNNSASHGTIHCFSAGNDREDANKKDLQSNPNAICVAALGSNGVYASYSNYGANVFVTAPSSGSTFNITTTDRMGEAYGYNGAADSFPDSDYTSRFGGTSSASPLVAGVMALAKQVRANLDVRFAKHLLVKTCDIVDPADTSPGSDGGWKINAAGNQFNQSYGFGLIDADELTQVALQYTGVTPLETASTGTIAVNQAILDDYPTGITKYFTIGSHTPLENLVVAVDITHTYHGDINIVLTSPSGTVSRLVQGRTGGPGQYTSHVWEYGTNAFWGEDPLGTWTINLADIWAVDTGTWNSFSVTANMGYLIPEPATLSLLCLGGVALIRRRRWAKV